jgi:hypothetical protein
MGGSFGVAIFGAIFSNRLAHLLPRLVPGSPARGADLVRADPAALKRLPPDVHAGLADAFARALHSVFLWAVPFGVVALLVTLFLRELPLRERRPVGVVAGEDFGMSSELEPETARAMRA